ncbi:23S rRNA (pseudouridine(1915)-N(3))-methyltransferase RlmH, partial [Thermovibrio sp.]
MKLRVVAVGKIAPHFKEAQEHYFKKVRNLEVIEVKKGKSREEEGERLLKKAKGFIVALDEKGREVTSREFAKIVEKHPTITFLIGGADGLSEEVKEKADLLLSLSKLTLQHDVARIVLLEQLFRAQEINRGSPY